MTTEYFKIMTAAERKSVVSLFRHLRQSAIAGGSGNATRFVEFIDTAIGNAQAAEPPELDIGWRDDPPFLNYPATVPT